MRTLHLVIALALSGILVYSCENPPKVLQGTVVSYEAASKTLVVKDERQPQQGLVFSLQGAEIGADPVVQDEVRIAYKDEGGQLVATRVMNLTRQKEIGKLDKGH
jgi:hypothetical protein